MSTDEPKQLSKEEQDKIIHELEDFEDEFDDAIENEGDLEKDKDGAAFSVSKEELSILRADLACEFPEDYDYLSDAYILSVASKPYSKDPTVRRPLEYTMEKLTHVMQWREESGAAEITDYIDMANGPESAPAAVENPQMLAKAKAIATALNYGSMYWHGLTKQGKPILWIRTNRKPWYPDVDAEIKALIAMTDAGIRGMPKKTTDFVVIADSTSPPPPNPSFMIEMLKALVKGYPDRLGLLVSAPISSIIQFVMNLLLPLMPGRLASKVILIGSEDVKSKLDGIIDEKDIPDFMGGEANHDKYYPIESQCTNKGQGNLKFDWYGMIDRLQAAKEEFDS
mmetsp:Transcript_18410/g.23886  ORF Transcript_18410/g.23886 Transcript_18410/m.23886 type:complete len:339 (-) Transcript_18410:146-1162(-)|eukprot:CAMPEP_0116054220 /NCGR_PEP_ID=MMETSP0322-20121206/2658_1 /TAXON_ID=163516 /ORGANISM="Leptocylindrus danicus var. apora, Strain B651" /LENGTH=338 /DNA_ID=CAMNT_0003537543 /DNA_START=101 /DNA_END=1117 /DNA_ORIENTATION=+